MASKRSSDVSLVIVESPAKARTINKYLGDGYVVKASMGHVRDLPERDFGIDINREFEPTYEILRGRAKVVNELRKLAEKADAVYLATDRDREGEAIAWHLAESLGVPQEKLNRVIFNEITRTAIREAFSNPHQIDLDRVNAQQARRILDRIVGYELSPLLWKKIAKGLSAGRVQSVAVRLIVDREREIRGFVPEESWRLLAYVAAKPESAAALAREWAEYRRQERTQKDQARWLAERESFQADLVEFDGKPFKPTNDEEAAKVLQALGVKIRQTRRQPWDEYQHLGLEKVEILGELDLSASGQPRITEVTTKRTTTRPSAPFTTASLQQQASTAMRFTASRTMRVAQGLYEGVDLHGEGPVGLITYMRTDSTNLAAEAVKGARSFIGREYGADYVPAEPQVYGKRQERAQEAHEAIRPTDPERTPESVRNALTDEQFKLYDLIWRRFIACQMTPAQWDSTQAVLSVTTSRGEARFTASGRRLVFDGFMRVSGITSDDALLPELKPQQPVGFIDLAARQQYTSPSPRYTEASLVKALEAEGIGRPSTYASIIDTIQDRGYVEQEDRKFFPTALGEVVTDKLVQHFPKVMDVKFTSHMEDELDKIEEAHLDWVAVLHEFYDPFRDLLNRATDEMDAVRKEKSPHKCPECGGDMVYRWSKTGRFLACDNYPKCKATRNVNRRGEPISPAVTDVACEVCGKPMVHRQSKTGHFLGCSGYPECRHTVAANEQGEPLRLVKDEELKRPCEACGQGTMVVKRKGRRAFLGCDRYPECKQTAQIPPDVRLERVPAPPPEPAGVQCDKCGRPMVIRSGKRGKFVACSGFPRCRNAKPIEKLEELRATQPASAEAQATGGGNGRVASAAREPGTPPPGFALTRTGKPVVEVMPAPGELLCPECGSPMDLRRGRFGPFYSCAGYPRCKFVANLRGEAKRQAEELMPAPQRPKPEPTDIACEECGKPMLIRQGRRGKFLGCSGYPACKSTRELPAGVA